MDKQIAAIGVDNALVQTAQINLGYCVIRAPFDGRVGLHQLDVGNLVQVASQTGIISLTQDKPISVVFTLPEADLGQSRLRWSKARFRSRCSTAAGNLQLSNGMLMTPNNTIDTATGTISMKATFHNDDNHLWPGEFVNARIQVDMLRHAISVPAAAVQHGPDGTFVYLVSQTDSRPDGLFRWVIRRQCRGCDKRPVW